MLWFYNFHESPATSFISHYALAPLMLHTLSNSSRREVKGSQLKLEWWETPGFTLKYLFRGSRCLVQRDQAVQCSPTYIIRCRINFLAKKKKDYLFTAFCRTQEERCSYFRKARKTKQSACQVLTLLVRCSWISLAFTEAIWKCFFGSIWRKHHILSPTPLEHIIDSKSDFHAK